MGTMLIIAFIALLCSSLEAQELTDARGSAVLTLTAKPRPVTAYYFPTCFVMVKCPKGTDFPQKKESKLTSFVFGVEKGSVFIEHEVTLSSISLTDYVEIICSAERLKHSGVTATPSIIKTYGDFAIIETSEVIINNRKFHTFQKVLKTCDGFATVVGIIESKQWQYFKDTFIDVVSSARLINAEESKAIGDNKCIVGMDDDGDMFLSSSEWKCFIDENGRRQMYRGRDYFLNQDKNRLAMAEQSALKFTSGDTKGMAGGRIRQFFGFIVGEDLDNLDKAYRLSDKTLRVREVMKLKEPFKVCKNVERHYSRGGCRLYKVILASDYQLNPDVKKMKTSVKLISEAICERFGNLLEMVESPTGYSAKFKFDVNQSLAIDIRSDQSNARRKRIVITFVDDCVRNDE